MNGCSVIALQMLAQILFLYCVCFSKLKIDVKSNACIEHMNVGANCCSGLKIISFLDVCMQLLSLSFCLPLSRWHEQTPTCVLAAVVYCVSMNSVSSVA